MWREVSSEGLCMIPWFLLLDMALKQSLRHMMQMHGAQLCQCCVDKGFVPIVAGTWYLVSGACGDLGRCSDGSWGGDVAPSGSGLGFENRLFLVLAVEATTELLRLPNGL